MRAKESSVVQGLRESRHGVPAGRYEVDAEALRRARQSVPKGEYHVDAEALRRARQSVPKGEYHVDAEALRRARQGVPQGEYHRTSEALDGTLVGLGSGASPYERARVSVPRWDMGYVLGLLPYWPDRRATLTLGWTREGCR